MSSPVFMPHRNAVLVLSMALIGLMTGCAHLSEHQKRDPQYLLGQACFAGSMVKKASGSVWIKAKSPETSGQFPADVLAQAPSTLKMEVTNLLGGTEATIVISGDQMVIDSLHKKPGETAVERQGSWAGIPLRWAVDLFLGRLPCPPEGAQLRSPGDDVLMAQTSSVDGHTETYEFHLRDYAGGLIAESLIWSQAGQNGSSLNRVEFHFYDPEDHTQSPKRWEAVSTRGEVKVRWRDRVVSD